MISDHCRFDLKSEYLAYSMTSSCPITTAHDVPLSPRGTLLTGNKDFQKIKTFENLHYFLVGGWLSSLRLDVTSKWSLNYAILPLHLLDSIPYLSTGA